MSVQPVVFLVRGFLREEVSPPGAGPGPGFTALGYLLGFLGSGLSGRRRHMTKQG